MIIKTRRKHSPVFMGQIALEAVLGERIVAEQYDVRPSQIADWKRMLLAFWPLTYLEPRQPLQHLLLISKSFTPR